MFFFVGGGDGFWFCFHLCVPESALCGEILNNTDEILASLKFMENIRLVSRTGRQ